MINKNSSHPEFISASRRSIKAFTLIELLVVVLIIGILAAVAVPMYKRAVLKSQFSTLMPLAKNLWEGNEVFYLNNGEYAASVDELDVSAPADPTFQITLGDAQSHQYARVTKTNLPVRVTMYQKHSLNFPDEIHCEALQDNEQANWLCEKGLQGTFVGNKFGYAVYSLSPDTEGTLTRTYYDLPNYSQVANGDICVGENGACRYMKFDDTSACVSKSSGACTYDTFTNGAFAVAGGSASSYNHSYCIGTTAWGCQVSGFENHSVCYAMENATCQRATYDETSCCTGTYCPTEEDTCTYKGITPPPAPDYTQY